LQGFEHARKGAIHAAIIAASITAFGVLPALGSSQADAAEAARAAEPVKAADLSKLHAKRRVRDSVLRRAPLARAASSRSEEFVDSHGHRIRVSTDLAGIDLASHAGVLAGTLHYDEIEDLQTVVVDPSRIEAICGEGAGACYMPEDPKRSYRGVMVIPSEDIDLAHIIVHEYGHHVDLQLDNLAHVFPGSACGSDNDGSRNWFFERDVEDDILGRGVSCDPGAEWDRLLGEVYAEDYAWLVGNRNWVLPRERSPTRLQLDALNHDLYEPLDRQTHRARHRAWRRSARTFKRLTLDDWRFVTIDLRGPPRAALALYLYERNGRRSVAKSVRPGTSRERVEYVAPPGRYDVVVHAYRRSGNGSVRINLD
jgi:hypothetical protein